MCCHFRIYRKQSPDAVLVSVLARCSWLCSCTSAFWSFLEWNQIVHWINQGILVVWELQTRWIQSPLRNSQIYLFWLICLVLLVLFFSETPTKWKNPLLSCFKSKFIRYIFLSKKYIFLILLLLWRQEGCKETQIGSMGKISSAPTCWKLIGIFHKYYSF